MSDSQPGCASLTIRSYKTRARCLIVNYFGHSSAPFVWLAIYKAIRRLHNKMKMVMKPRKVLCCRFLFAFWGLTVHKTWQNTLRNYACSCNKPTETLRLRYLYIVIWVIMKNKRCAWSWTVQPKSWLLLFSALMFTAIHEQFPLVIKYRTLNPTVAFLPVSETRKNLYYRQIRI